MSLPFSREAFLDLIEFLDEGSHLTDEEVLEELRAAGVDLDKGRDKFEEALSRIQSAQPPEGP